MRGYSIFVYPFISFSNYPFALFFPLNIFFLPLFLPLNISSFPPSFLTYLPPSMHPLFLSSIFPFFSSPFLQPLLPILSFLPCLSLNSPFPFSIFPFTSTFPFHTPSLHHFLPSLYLINLPIHFITFLPSLLSFCPEGIYANLHLRHWLMET